MCGTAWETIIICIAPAFFKMIQCVEALRILTP